MLRHAICPLALAFLATSCGGSTPPAPSAPPPPVASSSAAPIAAPAPAAPRVAKRVIVSLSRRSGTSVTTTAPDGTITVAFDEVENGRGPHTDATIRLAPDGTLASFEARGHHEMGQSFEETFRLDGGKATWKSREESGDRAVDKPTFFMPISPMMDADFLLAKALLKHGGSLPLLPGGEARIAEVGDATVTADGQTRHVRHFEITGLGLTPEPIWLDDDGEAFGYVNPWFSVVPEGWEPAIEPLVEKQMARDRARAKADYERLAKKPAPAGIAYTHARVLDVERGQWLADHTVVVRGDTIAAVGPSKTTKPPAGAEVVDLAGKAVVPGLWDMHAHFREGDGALSIASGVTTIRDVGNKPDLLDDFKKRFDDGAAIGPRVLRAGFIEGRGEKAASSEVTAETEAEAKAAVEFFAKRGYEQIKIYNSMKPELVPVLAKEAHARGMTVTGHIPVHMLANEAVRAGYDGIEHINMIALNFLADHDTDTRTTLRFSLVADKAADLDWSAKPVQDFFALLRAKHTVVDPTLVAFEPDFVGVQGKVTPGTEWIVERLPIQAQRWFLTGGLPKDGKEERYARSYKKLLDLVKAMHDAKIDVVIGTDALAGLMVPHEIELWVKGGISPVDALRAATIVPARVMKLDKKTGSIAPGKNADLAIVDGDPLADIAALRKVVSTVRGGVVFASADVFATVGVRPAM